MQVLFQFCWPHGIVTENFVTKYTLWSFFVVNHDRCKTVLQVRLIILLLFDTHLNNQLNFFVLDPSTSDRATFAGTQTEETRAFIRNAPPIPRST